MPYEITLSPDEKILKQVTQDLAGKGFLFWRRFTITLTNKRLHAYQKLMVSHGQKTFDLRDLDSIYQERRFNGLYAFFLGLLAFAATFFVGVIGMLIVQNQAVMSIFSLLGIIVWIAIVVLFFFRRLLIVRSRNDEMSIDVIRMPEGQLAQFVQSVLQQKESVLHSSSAVQTAPTGGTVEDTLRQLTNLRTQGLITELEFEAKKAQILNKL